MKSEAPRRRTLNGGHPARVETIGIDGDVTLAALRNPIEHRFHAFIVHFEGRDDVGTVGGSRFDLLRPCAALRADADLEDFTDMRHFGRAADRAPQPVSATIHLIPPVDISAHLYQRDRTM